MRPNTVERLLSRCVPSNGPIAGSPCMVWTGHVGKTGYGLIAFRGKTRLCHRVVYEHHAGEIPDGLCVMHTCDNRACCNASHLRVGTNKDNTRDMTSKGRQASGHRNGAYTKPECLRKGVKNGRAKITESDVVSIRAAYESGTSTIVALAKAYGVCFSNIWFIVTRQTWKHV